MTINFSPLYGIYTLFINGLFKLSLGWSSLTSRDLALMGFLLIWPSLYSQGGFWSILGLNFTFMSDPYFALMAPLIKPSYTIRGLHEMSLRQLLEATFQKYKPEKSKEEPHLILLNPHSMRPYFTLSQIIPLLRIFSEPRQGFTEVIQALSSAIMFVSDKKDACCQFYIMGIQFYLMKMGGSFLTLSPQSPLAWPWFPVQLTWLMQQVLSLMSHPTDRQLIWWWFGEPSQFVRPPPWTEKNIDWGGWGSITSWSHEKLMAPVIITQLLLMSEKEKEQAHAFLQEILNLYLTLSDLGPGYTHMLNQATRPPLYIIDPKGQPLYWQGYVGRLPAEEPEQILNKFQQLMMDIPMIHKSSVISWTKKRSVYPSSGS